MLVRIIRYTPFLMCLLCVNTYVAAQLQVWRHINTAEMANTNIMCMTEGPCGLIYLGTQDGVEVFDGRRFMPIVIPDRIKKGINPVINCFRWGRGGILWVATRTHIFTYNPANGDIKIVYGGISRLNINIIELDTVWQRVHVARDTSITSFNITDTGLVQTSKAIFPVVATTALGTDGSVYALLDDRNGVVKVSGDSYKVLYTAPSIRDVDYLPSQDALVMLTDIGIVMLDLKSGNVDTLPAKAEWLPGPVKKRLTLLANGQVLVHHANGICLFRNLWDTLGIHYSADEKNPASIQTNFIIFAFSDARKNIWVSEDGISLSVLPANSKPVKYISAKMTGAGRLWLSYHDTINNQVISSSEKGFCITHYKDNRVNYKAEIKPHDSLKFFEPMSYWLWAKDKILLATNGQGWWLFNTKTYSFSRFDSLNRYFNRLGFWGGKRINDKAYLLHAFNGVYHYTRQTGAIVNIGETVRAPLLAGNRGIPGNLQYFSSYIEKEQEIWLGGGYGIDILDTGLRFIKSYGNNKNGRHDGLSNTVILGIQRAGNGEMYVATMGGGVYRLTAADTFESVPLVGDIANIYCIGVFDKDNLVITTSKGMCLYNTATKESRLIDEHYGMPIADFNQFALAIDDKFVIASGSNGITITNRDGFKKCFYDTARLLVMKGLRPIRKFTLEKGKQLLDFDISIVGYAAQANWRIRYKLDGLDGEWHEMAKGEWHIRYNSITPGEYTLYVEAIDRQNVIWAAPIVVRIIALPYFWQTLWFRLLALVFCVGVLVVTVRFFSQLRLKWRLKKLEDEQKLSHERMRISRELHDNVGSNLTYLITGLESSQVLLDRHENEILEAKIKKMHSSARESMQQLRDSIWALNSETVTASVLISRFGKWLENIMEVFPATKYVINSEINTDVELDPIKSLNLFRVLQEAVHNVLKHANAGQLSINCVSNGNIVTISIEDDGKGFDPMKGKGNGTRTMAARAEEMGAKFTLVSEPGNGTKITLVVQKL